MNRSTYRSCVVPRCNNTSNKTPNKLFIHVPREKRLRKIWLNLVRRDPANLSPNSTIYFCEDHFDLPNDMDNYIQYSVMGSVPRICMKSQCVPTRFDCQPDRRKRFSNFIEQPCVLKKQRESLIEDIEKALAVEAVESTTTNYLDPSGSSSQFSGMNTMKESQEELATCPKLADKSVQVHMTGKYKSKAVQTKINLVSQLTSPIKPDRRSISTSPFKIENCKRTKLSTSGLVETSKILFNREEQPDSYISYTPALTKRELSSSIQSLLVKSTSDCSVLREEAKKEEKVRATLHRDVRAICAETCHFLGLDITRPAMELISELVYKKLSVYGLDLEAFAKHAKRSTINSEDVKLLARRNSSLKPHLNNIMPAPNVNPKEKRRKTVLPVTKLEETTKTKEDTDMETASKILSPKPDDSSNTTKPSDNLGEFDDVMPVDDTIDLTFD